MKRTGIYGAWDVMVMAALGILLVGMLAINWLAFRFVRTSYGEWQAWFAWRPVRVQGRTYWLTHVERSLGFTHDLVSFKKWRYRPLEPVK